LPWASRFLPVVKTSSLTASRDKSQLRKFVVLDRPVCYLISRHYPIPLVPQLIVIQNTKPVGFSLVLKDGLLPFLEGSYLNVVKYR